MSLLLLQNFSSRHAVCSQGSSASLRGSGERPRVWMTLTHPFTSGRHLGCLRVLAVTRNHPRVGKYIPRSKLLVAVPFCKTPPNRLPEWLRRPRGRLPSPHILAGVRGVGAAFQALAALGGCGGSRRPVVVTGRSPATHAADPLSRACFTSASLWCGICRGLWPIL